MELTTRRLRIGLQTRYEVEQMLAAMAGADAGVGGCWPGIEV